MKNTVLTDIEKDPKAFFKKLKKYFKFELTYTVTFKRWEKKKLNARIRHLKALRKYPGEISAIANIIRCLDKYYPKEGKIDYGNKTVVETAVVIYESYNNRIWKYMQKRLKWDSIDKIIVHTKEEALAEQIARGFVLKQDVDLNHKLPYIRSIVDNNYVYPAQVDLNQTYEIFPKIGVTGYTGIKPPRNFN